MSFPHPEDGLFEGDLPAARRALARRRRRRRVRQAVGGIVVLAAGIAILAGMGVGARALFTELREKSTLFQVRGVDVGRTESIPPWEVADYTDVAPGHDLLDVSEESVAHEIEKNPRVRSATVTRTWARTVHIEVTERVPVAVWLGSELLEISEDGTVLGPAPASSDGWRTPGTSWRAEWCGQNG